MASITAQSLLLDLKEVPASRRFLGQGDRLPHLHAGNWVSSRSEIVVRLAIITTTTTAITTTITIIIITTKTTTTTTRITIITTTTTTTTTTITTTITRAKSRVRIITLVPSAVRVLPVSRRTNPPAKHPRVQVPALVLHSPTTALYTTLQLHRIARTPTLRWLAAVLVPLLLLFQLRLAALEDAQSANLPLLVFTQINFQMLVKLLLHRPNSIFWVFCPPQVGESTRQIRLQTQLPIHHLQVRLQAQLPLHLPQLRQSRFVVFSKHNSPQFKAATDFLIAKILMGETADRRPVLQTLTVNAQVGRSRVSMPQ